MRVIKRLGLWDIKPRLPPQKTKAQSLRTEPYIDYSDSQGPPSDNGFMASL
jgi:hypothetical protein